MGRLRPVRWARPAGSAGRCGDPPDGPENSCAHAHARVSFPVGGRDTRNLPQLPARLSPPDVDLGVRVALRDKAKSGHHATLLGIEPPAERNPCALLIPATGS